MENERLLLDWSMLNQAILVHSRSCCQFGKKDSEGDLEMTEKEITITCTAGPPCPYHHMDSLFATCSLEAGVLCQYQRPLIHREPGLDRKLVIAEIRGWAREYTNTIGPLTINTLCERIEKL